jgi:ribosomal protein S18 acetylase RimI-like enzyme/predicted kinase
MVAGSNPAWGAVFELRSFQPGDIEAVWELHDAALEEAGVHGGRGPWEDDLRDIRATYLEPGGNFLVAFADGRLVGMGGLVRLSPTEAEIKRMRVHPDFQRQGFGRRILGELEARAVALRCKQVRLDTTTEQVAARRLYEGAGYRETGRREMGRFVFIDFVKALDASTPRERSVLIVTGPPGVGKSTTAEILAARSPRAVHLESDVFFGFVRSGYVAPWKPESHEQNRIVMGIVAHAAAEYAAAGYHTIVDGIVIPDWFLEPLADRLRAAGCQVAYAVLRASLSTCTERARERGREPLGDPTVIEQLWMSFADLGELERNAIDLDGEDAEEAANCIERRMASGLLAI